MSTAVDLRRVIVSQQELQLLKVVENAVEGRLSAGEAAELLGICKRVNGR
jgi:predicted HTH domain antitoxin